jgi:hypothetical protein
MGWRGICSCEIGCILPLFSYLLAKVNMEFLHSLEGIPRRGGSVRLAAYGIKSFRSFVVNRNAVYLSKTPRPLPGQ